VDLRSNREEVDTFAKIGIIGSGAVGRAVATRAVAAGIPVVLSNSRGPDTLTEVVDELGTGASAGTVAQVADADLVVIAIPFVKIPELAGEALVGACCR
jgi:predicted dinucleotide-binding enzyme